MITIKDTYAGECFRMPVSREGCRAMMDYHLYYYRYDLRRAGTKSGITSLIDYLSKISKKPSCNLAAKASLPPGERPAGRQMSFALLVSLL